MQNTTQNSETKRKSKWLRKTFKWFFLLLLLLIFIIIGGVYYVIHYFDWQSKVRELVHTYGSQAVGTDVNIGRIDVSLENGNGSVSNITVANPKGYSQEYIIKLGNVAVNVDKNSVVKIIKETAKKSGSKVKTVVINEIRVEKPEVTYELMNLKQNNADDILANIKKNTASSAKTKTPEIKDKDATQYNVAIKKVVVTGGEATVAANLLGASQSLSLSLPTITISNLGTEKQGISIEDGLARVFQEILKTTVNVVSKADLSSLLGGVSGLATGAVDAATGAVGTAAETAGKAVDGVTDGVKNIGNGIGGLFK